MEAAIIVYLSLFFIEDRGGREGSQKGGGREGSVMLKWPIYFTRQCMVRIGQNFSRSCSTDVHTNAKYESPFQSKWKLFFLSTLKK